MPDDSLVKDEKKEEKKEEAQFITKDDLKTSLGELTSQFNQNLKAFGEQVAGAIKAPEKKEEEPNVSLTDKQNALLDDPDAYIEARAQEMVQQAAENNPDSIGNKVLLSNAFETHVTAERKGFVEKYGDKLWDEAVLPQLAAATADMQPAMKASSPHITMLVRGIKGGIDDDVLAEARSEVMSSDKDNPPVMITGIGVPRPKGSPLGGDEKEILAEMNKNGMNVTSEEYVKFRDGGDTEENFAPKEAS